MPGKPTIRRSQTAPPHRRPSATDPSPKPHDILARHVQGHCFDRTTQARQSPNAPRPREDWSIITRTYSETTPEPTRGQTGLHPSTQHTEVQVQTRSFCISQPPQSKNVAAYHQTCKTQNDPNAGVGDVILAQRLSRQHRRRPSHLQEKMIVLYPSSYVERSPLDSTSFRSDPSRTSSDAASPGAINHFESTRRGPGRASRIFTAFHCSGTNVVIKRPLNNTTIDSRHFRRYVGPPLRCRTALLPLTDSSNGRD